MPRRRNAHPSETDAGTQQQSAAVRQGRTRLIRARVGRVAQWHSPNGIMADVIGDVHGCFAEMVLLLAQLGYRLTWHPSQEWITAADHPDGRLLVFLGDLGDRGPSPFAVMESVRQLVTAGPHEALLGNHDVVAARFLGGDYRGWRDYIAGFETTYDALVSRTEAERVDLARFLDSRPTQLIVTESARPVLALSHAGVPRALLGRSTVEAERAAVQGAWSRAMTKRLKDREIHSTEPLDPGLADWITATKGPWMVCGHHSGEAPLRAGRLVIVDSGCAAGHSLSAFRFPETELVSVAARMRARGNGQTSELEDIGNRE